MSFVISSAGDLKGANVVNLGAPKIVLNTVKLYSSAFYTVNPAATVPQGTLVYTGTVLSVNLLSSTSAEVLIQVETTATERVFRSIGIFDSDGQLYCTHVYTAAQVQMARNSEQGHRFVLRCHVTPAQGVQVLQLTNSTFKSPAVASSMSAIPPVSTVGCILVPDASGATLHMCSDGVTWTLDGHVVIRAASNVSAVTTVGGKTVMSAPGFDTNVPTTSVGRYVVVSPDQQVARVESISGNNVTLNGSYPWVTLGASLTIWENYGFRVRTHPDQPNPHPAYLTEAQGDGQYAMASHTTAINPHNQYLSDIQATADYTALSHVVEADPHSQYALKSFMDGHYLSSLQDNYITDAGGQTRLRLNSTGPTFLYGGKLTQTSSAFSLSQPDVFIGSATFGVTLLGALPTSPVYQVRSKDGFTIALTNSRIIYRSADYGTTWTNQSMTEYQSANWYSWWSVVADATHLAATRRFFVALTDKIGKFSTSTDGVAWTYREDPSVPVSWSTLTTAYFTCSAWSGAYLLAAGTGGALASSPDGLSWRYYYPSGSVGLVDTAWPVSAGGTDSRAVTGVCWNGYQFTLVGFRGRVATSTDMQTWTYVAALSLTTWGTATVRCCAADLSTNLILVGGDNGQLALSTSRTATGWSNKTANLSVTPWGNKAVLSACHNGTVWLIGGAQGALAWSFDATTWNYLPALAASSWGANSVRHIEWTGRRFLLTGDNQKFATFPSENEALAYTESSYSNIAFTPKSADMSYGPSAQLRITDESKSVPSTAWVQDTLTRRVVIERYLTSAGVEPPELLLASFNESHVYRVINKRSILLNTVLVEDAEYELLFVATTRLDNSDVILMPNDVNYGDVINTKAYVRGFNGSAQVVIPWANVSTYFRCDCAITYGRHPTGRMTINTKRNHKVSIAQGQDSDGVATTASRWQDSTTQWRVLGRFGTAQSFADTVDAGWSWYVSVRRVG